jgi:hypothetical protein
VSHVFCGELVVAKYLRDLSGDEASKSRKGDDGETHGDFSLVLEILFLKVSVVEKLSVLNDWSVFDEVTVL